MSRSISGAMQTWLGNESVTLAYCVKLTRRDGVIFGFTSFDRDITFSSQLYEASNSMIGSAIKSAVGTGVDNMDIIALLRSDRINQIDIQAGIYDTATLEIFAVNWADLTMGKMILLKGLLGEIRMQDGQFTVEIRSLAQRLTQQIGELTTSSCRARLGDSRCTINLAGTDPITGLGYRVSKTVTVVTDALTLTFGSVSQASSYFAYGVVTFTSGLNTGLSREIKSHTNSAGAAALSLQEQFPYAIAVGDVATLQVGCDGLFPTCVSKFANAVNNQSNPHVPGIDKISQVGKSGL